MKKKPRGPAPSLIGSTNGRPARVQIKKNGHECKRCGEPFIAGKTCIAIPQLGAGYSSVRRVCDECFAEILKKTSADLEEVKAI
jgi:RNase P subunit RPR2